MITFVRKGRASFTLVELLVVIAIIGILTAMIAGVAAGALARARWARIKIEVDNLATAIEAYRAEVGEYPPDFNDTALVRAHLQKRYPRWNGSSWNPPALDEAQALVYWLRGHSKNPVNPFDTANPGDSFYDFQRPRMLVPGSLVVADLTPANMYPGAANLYPMYVPEGGQNVPFIYFNAVSYTPTLAHVMATPTPRYLNLKIPYVSDIAVAMNDEWINPRTFQIISAGPDGDWGNVLPHPVLYQNVARYPSGRGYIRGDYDNATNFSVTTLESAKP